MKIVTTIQENESVKVQRFEKDVLVGERKVRLEDYCIALMQQLPVGTLIEHLANEKSQMETYLSELEESGIFEDFLSLLLDNVPTCWLNESPSFLKYLEIAVRRLNVVNANDPFVVDFLTTITRLYLQLPMDSKLVELMIQLLKRFINEKSDEALQQKKHVIFNAIFDLLSEEDKEQIKRRVANIIPHLDANWFAEMILEAQKYTHNKVTYFSGSLPKDVAYMSVSSKGISYVYEVPKARIRVNYQNVPIHDVGHPRLLAIYRLKSDKIQSMKLVAVKDKERIHDDMQVYHYPYSHVNFYGDVCWDYKSLTSDMMPLAANLFLSATTSNHYRENAFELYKENEGKDFDDNKLIPFGLLKELL